MIKYYEHGTNNVGDTLSGLILKHFLPKEDWIEVNGDIANKVVSCGSVMSKVLDGDTVWGTGIIRKDFQFNKDATFLAVRGKLTRQSLLDSGVRYVPEVYGDPALLLPLIYKKKRPKKLYDIGYVPHYTEKDLFKGKKFIDVELPVEKFIDEVLKYKKIVSSSLHGIIIAEAYGIPAEWAVWSNNLTGGEFKFRDYLTGTGRNEQGPGEFPPISNLKEIQEGLIEALTKKRMCVITRMHYRKDHPDFEWRFNYYKDNVLPALKKQVYKNFDIAVWCEKHHEKLFKDLGVKTFQATHPDHKKKLFADFTTWDNVSGLKEYSIQVALDSDDIVVPEFTQKVADLCVGQSSVHLSFQPIKLKGDKKYRMAKNYEMEGSGSAIYAIYQPKFKYFCYEKSHLSIGELMDKTIYIPEGYAYVSIHRLNDSTKINKEDTLIKDNKKMDICYLVHSESDSDMLKYSIRSAEKNIDYRDIFIVGKRPEYLFTEEINYKDINASKRHSNITGKLLEIIKDPRVSENFIVFNDDFFINEKFKTIPYYYIGSLKEFHNNKDRDVFIGNNWDRIIEAQLKRFPDGKMFTPHFPIVYNKKKLYKLIKSNPKIITDCLRSWYANTYKIEGVLSNDYKIYKSEDINYSTKASFFSTSDWAETNKEFLNRLNGMYYKQSSYEMPTEIVVILLKSANMSKLKEALKENKGSYIILGAHKSIEHGNGYFIDPSKYSKLAIEQVYKTKIIKEIEI